MRSLLSPWVSLLSVSLSVASVPPSCPGLYPHPSDCSQFYQCDTVQSYLFHCPEGTLFDGELGLCNHAYLVTCQASSASSASSVTASVTASVTEGSITSSETSSASSLSPGDSSSLSWTQEIEDVSNKPVTEVNIPTDNIIVTRPSSDNINIDSNIDSSEGESSNESGGENNFTDSDSNNSNNSNSNNNSNGNGESDGGECGTVFDCGDGFNNGGDGDNSTNNNSENENPDGTGTDESSSSTAGSGAGISSGGLDDNAGDNSGNSEDNNESGDNKGDSDNDDEGVDIAGDSDYSVSSGSLYPCTAPGYFTEPSSCSQFYVCKEVAPGVLSADRIHRWSINLLLE